MAVWAGRRNCAAKMPAGASRNRAVNAATTRSRRSRGTGDRSIAATTIARGAGTANGTAIVRAAAKNAV